MTNQRRILAIVRDDDALLHAERERLSTWAPPNRWEYIEYRDAVDLLSRLSARRAQPIDALEIVGHGNPAECDDVALENVRTFGEALAQAAGFTHTTEVYLSGCNTGLEFDGDCIARDLPKPAVPRSAALEAISPVRMPRGMKGVSRRSRMVASPTLLLKVPSRRRATMCGEDSGGT